MTNRKQFYFDGGWVDPVHSKSLPVVSPATEEVLYDVAIGSKEDVDKGGGRCTPRFRRLFDDNSKRTRGTS